jgi:hypothetical protein
MYLVMLFERALFWNDKCNHAIVDGVVVGVNQGNEHLVRTGGKTLQDDWVAARICPYPWGIVEVHMNVSYARRDSQSIGAEHRRNVQVLSTILNDHRSPGGERFGQRRIDDDLRWRLTGDQWDYRGGSTLAPCALCHSGRCVQQDGSDR